MNKRLSVKDIIALGFMTFALFVGAGNIIFPPAVGLQSGEHVWMAALGFLITSVGLPVLTVIALARVGGGVDTLSSPIGRTAGIALATVCYLTVGPLFATPRTATVSYEIGIAPLVGESFQHAALLIYSLIYFSIVIGISFFPGRLLDSVGHVLAPLKILALFILGIAAFLWPAGGMLPATEEYQRQAFSTGFVQGYLTMDTLGALVFGIVIVNAVRSRGIESTGLVTRYTVIAGLIAGLGLALIYICLFKLGSGSGALVAQDANGAAILHAYVQKTFGNLGGLFLSVLIFIACIVTAVGLTCACAEFFSALLPISYRALVAIIAVFSMVVSNMGLSQLIHFSVPVLTAIYPPCIVLVVLSFTQNYWRNPTRIMAPTILVSLVFGILTSLNKDIADALPHWLSQALNMDQLLAWISHLPMAEQGMAWLPPTLIVLALAAIWDRSAKRA